MCANTCYIISNHIICPMTAPWHTVGVTFLCNDFAMVHKAGYYCAHREIMKYRYKKKFITTQPYISPKYKLIRLWLIGCQRLTLTQQSERTTTWSLVIAQWVKWPTIQVKCTISKPCDIADKYNFAGKCIYMEKGSCYIFRTSSGHCRCMANIKVPLLPYIYLMFPGTGDDVREPRE